MEILTYPVPRKVRGSTGRNLDVVFGGGRRMFSPSWVPDLETGQPGLRGDIDLIAEWRADKVNYLDNALPSL